MRSQQTNSTALKRFNGKSHLIVGLYALTCLSPLPGELAERVGDEFFFRSVSWLIDWKEKHGIHVAAKASSVRAAIVIRKPKSLETLVIFDVRTAEEAFSGKMTRLPRVFRLLQLGDDSSTMGQRETSVKTDSGIVQRIGALWKIVSTATPLSQGRMAVDEEEWIIFARDADNKSAGLQMARIFDPDPAGELVEIVRYLRAEISPLRVGEAPTSDGKSPTKSKP